MLYSPDGRVSIRRKANTGIKCDKIARRLNGGDHSYAAAGVTKEDARQLLTILKTIKELQNILKDL